MFVIASDDSQFAARWRQVIGTEVPARVFDSLERLLGFLKEQAAGAIILDMNLPHARQMTVIKAVAAAGKQARLILAGMAFMPETELAVLAQGAVACCPPDMPEAECRKILEAVSKKGVWLSSSGIHALVSRLQDLPRQQDLPRDVYGQEGGDDLKARYPEDLTRREQEISRLVLSGKSNREIAACLGITERTTKAHLTAIFRKLHVQNRAQMIARFGGSQSLR
ncbi:MAG: response regulator transcription factor [Alistipes senegalensis]|nr:response regulator transcription factor [Oxalobacter formigenes]MCM1280674.1 response regulator transcription factor [Alistipes senegalensis]